jgi:SAM-dependent methyltransferase
VDCCRSGPCEEIFKPRMARRSLERFRKKGLGKLERQMVESVSTGGRVLDIGGGIGALQAELLDRGAEQGEVVELVSAWEPYARELARERGLEERTSFRVADVLEEPHAVEPADVVVLNRVVCCSPDGVALAGRAGALTRRALVVSFPRDAFWVRAGLGLVNLAMRARGGSFRVFVHPPSALAAAVEAEGLTRSGGGRGPVWEFAAFQRST